MHIVQIAVDGAWSIAWCFYLAFVTVMTAARVTARERFQVNGNPFEDFFASLFLYPNVALQLDESTKHLEKNKQNGKVNDMKMEDPENGKVNNAFEK